MVYYHLEGREGPTRKAQLGFVREGFLSRIVVHRQKCLYEMTIDRRHSSKIALARMLSNSKVIPLVYDLGLQTPDRRFYEPISAYEIDPVPGWGVKGRLDCDLRRVILKHMLRGILLTFIESDANLEEDSGSFATQYRLKWVIDPGWLVDPIRLRRISQKHYFRMLERIWTYLGVKSVPHKTARTGALLMMDLNAIFSILRTAEGRSLVHEALQEANQRFKEHAKRIKKMHEPLIYPKLPRRTWLQASE